MTGIQGEAENNQRIARYLGDLTLEDILHAAATGEYDPEAGDLALQPELEHAREVAAAINVGLEDGPRTRPE